MENRAPEGSESIDIEPVRRVKLAVMDWLDWTLKKLYTDPDPTEFPLTTTSSIRYPTSGIMEKSSEPPADIMNSPEGTIEPPGPASAMIV
jgi:hypothetical protein